MADNKDRNGAFGHNGNPLPGFVLHQNIVFKTNCDWYNTSHKCIQGSSKPAKYVVLDDTTGLSAERDSDVNLSRLLHFWKSYAIYRRASYCEACKFLAERARLYMKDMYAPGPTPAGQPRSTYSPTDVHRSGVIAASAKNTMFYI